MSEMVERVARAICEARGINPDHIGELPRNDGVAVMDHAFSQWMLHRKEARAAIEAMREPTKGMLDSVDERKERSLGAGYVWQAMIDEALK